MPSTELGNLIRRTFRYGTRDFSHPFVDSDEAHASAAESTNG